MSSAAPGTSPHGAVSGLVSNASSAQMAHSLSVIAPYAAAHPSSATPVTTCATACTSPPSASTLGFSTVTTRWPSSARTSKSGHGVGSASWSGRTAAMRPCTQDSAER